VESIFPCQTAGHISVIEKYIYTQARIFEGITLVCCLPFISMISN